MIDQLLPFTQMTNFSHLCCPVVHTCPLQTVGTPAHTKVAYFREHLPSPPPSSHVRMFKPVENSKFSTLDTSRKVRILYWFVKIRKSN